MRKKLILKAKHNFIIHPFFKIYTLWKISRNFKESNIIGHFEDRKLPVLILSNHVSWWDGFWLMYLNLKSIKRKYHFMMLENQLRKYWFFNYTGGFSVNKNNKSIIETLNYTSELLQNKTNMVMMFPQGGIKSMHENEIKFEKGIEKILKNNIGKIHILLVANIIDYFSSAKPILNIYIEEFKEMEGSSEKIEAAYQNFYNRCLSNQKSRTND